MGLPNDMFRQIVDNFTEVVWMVETDFETVLYVNPAYESLVGQVGDPDPAAVIHPQNREEAAEWLASIEADIEAGTVQKKYPLDVNTTDYEGNERWLRTIGVPMYEDETVVGLAGVSSDVTEFVEREQQLEDQVDQLNQFASMVSHDLRNPPSVAIGSLEQYRAQGNEERLDEIDESLQEIRAIVSDMLNLVRSVEGVSDPESVRLVHVSEEAWAATETEAATLETTDATIEADPSLLQRLLENLFRNTMDHGGEEEIIVRVGGLPDGFFVEDTGSGIETEESQDVFKHSQTTGHSGVGVGLTIVQQIADAHDWDISLTESEEGGLRFEFRHS